jgi:HAD superfamily hydrolase (TIGR01509 family)
MKNNYPKLIIFDLDGVILDAKEIHFECLNQAIASVGEQYIISRKEHLLQYDGLSTKKKLTILSKQKGFPTNQIEFVWEKKQELTLEYLNRLNSDHELIELFKKLKEFGYVLAVCSNSIRKTIKTSVLKLGLSEYIDFYISNEDVFEEKPNPEMFLRAMIAAKSFPTNTIIVEDSYVGRLAASRTGAILFGVKSPTDLKNSNFLKFSKEFIMKEHLHMKWTDKTMNVLIPMAGRGSRFEKAGYTFPKPLIDVCGKPMIQVVVENLNVDANFVFIVLKEHYIKYNLQNVLENIAPKCKIVQVDSVTEGAACTTLLAKEYINNQNPLLIANSDQFVGWDSSKFMYAMEADGIDGGILTFSSTHPKWSFCKTDEFGVIQEVAEKNPISNKASVGIYYWKKGSDYVKYAEQMISKNIRVNNEFYICPVYNEAIEDKKLFKIHHIDSMWGLGTPEDLNYYLNNYKKT